MKYKILIIFVLVIGVLIPSPTFANMDHHNPLVEFLSEIYVSLLSGSEPPTTIVSMGFKKAYASSRKPKKPVNEYNGFLICTNPTHTGCLVDTDPSIYSSNMRIFTWKEYVSRRLGLKSVRILGILYDPVNQQVIIYFKYPKTEFSPIPAK